MSGTMPTTDFSVSDSDSAIESDFLAQTKGAVSLIPTKLQYWHVIAQTEIERRDHALYPGQQFIGQHVEWTGFFEGADLGGKPWKFRVKVIVPQHPHVPYLIVGLGDFERRKMLSKKITDIPRGTPVAVRGGIQSTTDWFIILQNAMLLLPEIAI